MPDTTDTTTGTTGTTEDAAAMPRPTSRRPRPGRRPTRWSPANDEKLGQDAAEHGDPDTRRAVEDAGPAGRMSEIALKPTETAPDGEVLGLSAEQYQRGAEVIVEKGGHHADKDADGTPRKIEWGDAFTPAADAVQGDAEPGGRDERHRQQLREAEAERDKLAGLVESMRTSDIERLVTGRLADPRDLFRDGAMVADMLDDEGRVDAARVDRAVTDVLQAHPHWAQPLAKYKGSMFSGATAVPIEPRGKQFQDAFSPNPDGPR